MVRNEHWTQELEDTLFQLPGTPLDPVEIVEADVTVYDLLVRVGVFPSKSQARKNWKGAQIVPGFNWFEGIGKMRRCFYVWVPLDTNEPPPVSSCP